MILIESYWRGHDSRYRGEWTEVIQKNGIETVRRVNLLLAEAEKDGIIRDTVSSGWRTKGVNDDTKNAAKASRHITAEACDVHDPGRALAQWCLKNQNQLCKCELWIEDPRWSPNWVHFQCSTPQSGKRVYIPSSKPPLAEALEGQRPIPVRLKI